MSRPLRIEFSGALYHVTSRGDGQEVIFLGDEDRHRFLDVLSDLVHHFNWAVHAYCLMDNPYHLLIETSKGKGMRHLNGVYAQRFNRRHGRVEHVFQGRYKAIIVHKESYLLELARYVVLSQSSYGAHSRPMAMEQLSRYEVTWTSWQTGKINRGCGRKLKNQIFLGSDEFVVSLQRTLDSDASYQEIPAAQRQPTERPLTQIAEAHGRDEAIFGAYASGGYSLKEIGDHFRLHYSRVSRIVKQQRLAKSKT